MYARVQRESFQEVSEDGPDDPDQAAEPSDESHSLLAEDPLTGLPWTETLLPLITHWGESSGIHAICLHFVGLGILANIPDLQSSHSLLRDAAVRLVPLMKDHDRLTRFSGNKLLIFSKRPEAGIRSLLVEVADRLESFGVDAEGRHLPEVRIGMATLGGGPGAVTVDTVNTLMNNAVEATVPLTEVVAPRRTPGANGAPPVPAQSAPEPTEPAIEPGPEDAPPMTSQVAIPATDAPPPRLSWSSDERAAAEETVDTTEKSEETTMITRGHLERTPIRQAEAAATAVESAPPASSHRLILTAVDVIVTGLVATAVVDLIFKGQKVRAKAIGRSSDSHQIGLIAEALGRAITDLLPAGHGVVFRQAIPTSTDAGDVVVTVVELLTPDKTQALFGVAPTESEPVAGIARSVLNAVNHSIAHLLGAGE